MGLSIHQILQRTFNEGNDTLKMTVVSEPSSVPVGTAVFPFGEINAVASSSETDILQYTATGDARLYLVSVSGTNSAQFRVKLNNNTVQTCRTSIIKFNEIMPFGNDLANGLDLVSGDIVKVTVIHERPYVGEFESTLHITEFA